ncbi:hypothetical protein [Roseateles saccharophilus]|uniref:hypothetical protein n=1 Tax=Roseateles saccharophilus TaxID=304 RepID=UPI0010534094|nr:hypothetical protein [Roseateles saccharophilus]MDG0836152.1 hypothetical protein [Roseateles saccharophilus]
MTVTPIFEGPRALMVSAHTAVQNLLTGGHSNVPLDYSIGFDSNFADKLKAMLHGRNVEKADRDRVTAVLKLKAANPRVQLDVQPFLIENTRFDRDQDDNDRPWTPSSPSTCSITWTGTPSWPTPRSSSSPCRPTTCASS